MSQIDDTKCVDCGAPIGTDEKNCQYCASPNPHYQNTQVQVGPNGSRTVTTTTTTTTTTTSSSSSSTGGVAGPDMSAVRDMMKNMKLDMKTGFDPDFAAKMQEAVRQTVDKATATPTAAPVVQPAAQEQKPAPKGGCLGMIVLIAGMFAFYHFALAAHKTQTDTAISSRIVMTPK